MSYWDGTQWVADAPAEAAIRARPSRVRHVMGAVAEGGLIALLSFGLIAGTTFAAKGGHVTTHGGSSTSISVPDGTFGGTTTATVGSPGMSVYDACSQNGIVVSQQWVPTDGAGQAVLQLGPTMMWTGGSATCIAQVGTWSSKGRWVVQGSTTFNVAG
jgi:hypothetical protein